MSMFHRAGRLLIAAPMLAAVSLLLSGCGCTESVEIRNESGEPIIVELALPFESYARTSRQGCHFRARLGAGESWSTRQSSRDDRVSLPMRMANGGFVLRVRSGRNILDPWQVFVGQRSEDAVFEISPSEEGRYSVVARTIAGQSLRITRSNLNWFDEPREKSTK